MARLAVFPTSVGMNRCLFSDEALTSSVPHVRGDEPLGQCLVPASPAVFPTSVGMNRTQNSFEILTPRVPHVRGDEPITCQRG